MEHPKPWPLVEEAELLTTRVFDVQRARATSPRTKETHDFYRLVAPDWVNVVVVTEDEQVVMVRQFRYGSRDVTLEIPGGMVDPGESPGAAASREVLEETGYAGDPARELGVVNPNPALFGNRCYTYLVENARRVAEIRNEGAEETALALVSLSDVSARLRSGEIDHALVVAGLHWYAMDRGLV